MDLHTTASYFDFSSLYQVFHTINMPHSLATDDTSNGSTPPRRGVYLLTHPRSASNLFQTMMSKQKSHGVDVQSSGYHFFDASFPTLVQMDKGSLKGWTDAQREGLYEPYKAAYEKLNGELANAEKEVREYVSLCLMERGNTAISTGEVSFCRPGKML